MTILLKYVFFTIGSWKENNGLKIFGLKKVSEFEDTEPRASKVTKEDIEQTVKEIAKTLKLSESRQQKR